MMVFMSRVEQMGESVVCQLMNSDLKHVIVNLVTFSFAHSEHSATNMKFYGSDKSSWKLEKKSLPPIECVKMNFDPVEQRTMIDCRVILFIFDE